MLRSRYLPPREDDENSDYYCVYRGEGPAGTTSNELGQNLMESRIEIHFH